MNEFAYFNFTSQSGIQNTVADALSRYPLTEKHLRKYSKACSVDEAKATFVGADNQSEKMKHGNQL